MKATLIIALFVTLIGGLSLPQSLWAQSVFENPQPGSFQSGVGVISGWVCDAERIEIVFLPVGGQAAFFNGVDIYGYYGSGEESPPEGGLSYQAAYGTAREDTKDICGDIDNGFGLLFNWNRLGDGQHTVSVLADGVEFGNVTITVTTLGQEPLEGVSGEFVVEDFPADGNDISLGWQQTLQNFVIAAADTPEPSWGEKVRGVLPKRSRSPLHTLENPPPARFKAGVGVSPAGM